MAPVYFALSERYAVDGLLSRISGLPRGDRWQALARAALRYDLYAALESLTVAVLTGTPAASRGSGSRRGRARTRTAVDRAPATLDEIARLGEAATSPSLSVALRTLRGVVRSGAATA